MKHTITHMIEQYFSKRDQLVGRHDLLTPEQFEKELEQVEKLNPLERLGIDRKKLEFIP